MSIVARRMQMANSGAVNTPPSITPTGYTFKSSGLSGGGTVNVMAVSPFKDANGRRPYVCGADVFFISVSTDEGRTWRKRNGGRHVASTVWSPQMAGKCFAACDEGIYRSTDFGESWQRRSGATDFDANGSYRVDGNNRPRMVGNLLAVDDSGSTKYLWAACQTQGVKQSTDDGNSWNATALAGDHLNSIAQDPNNPDVVYVAVGNQDRTRNGIWVSTNARSSSMSFSKVAGYPGAGGHNVPEELFALDDNGTTKLYVAGNLDGIFMYDGSSWTSLNNGIPTGSGAPMYESIVGKIDGGNIVLFAGACQLTLDTMYQGMMKSTDGGANWTFINADKNAVNWTMFGTDQLNWMHDSWFERFPGPHNSNDQLALDPDHPDWILRAGSGGTWMGVDSGSGYQWQCTSNGLMACGCKLVAADPAKDGVAASTANDFVDFVFTDNGKNPIQHSPPVSVNNVGHNGDALYYDAEAAVPGQPTPLYVTNSGDGKDKNDGTGQLFSCPDPVNSNTWTDELLPVQNDVLSLAVGRAANGDRVILANVIANGLWRKQADSWMQVASDTQVGPYTDNFSVYGNMAFQPGSQVVYAVDNNGLWRSDSSGEAGSWLRILAGSSTWQVERPLALDALDSNVVYYSDASSGRVYRVNNAGTSTGTGATNATAISPTNNSGAIDSNKNGYLIINDTSGKLWFCANPRAASPTFVDMTDDYYRNACEIDNSYTRSVALGPDNYIYTAGVGLGVSVGVPQYS